MLQSSETRVVQADGIDRDTALPVEKRVNNLLARMTLDEKIGQMAQVEKNSITPDAVAAHGIGSVLSGGGGYPDPNTTASWAAMVRHFQEGAQATRLGIPLLYGVDAVHGHNNLHGAVIFPHNIGLGATGDPALVERVGRITARELMATGVRWNFAPTVAVPQDIRWGRTYEAFAAVPERVAEMGVALLRGLQGRGPLNRPGTVLASVKHFVGDGGTRWGTTPAYEWLDGLWQGEEGTWQIDQGVTDVDESTLRRVHLPPYQAAIAAGARNIMVSYSSWAGRKMHAQRYLLTDVLKGEMGFDGFLVSDWMGIDQIAPDYDHCVVTAINAGLDMIMVPFDYERFISTLRAAVERGDVPPARIDDAVHRILTVKVEMGLFQRPFGDDSLLAYVGSPAHRDVAREAVRKSLVLLKNDGPVLPLTGEPPHLLVAGRAADDIGLQCGGWTIEWMGRTGAITPGTTLVQALRERTPASTRLSYDAEGAFEGLQKRAEVGIVVLGEPPYAEGTGDRADLRLTEEDVALLQRVRARCDRLVLILYSGRPLLLTEQLPLCDAVVAAWLPGTEGHGIADVLFGDFPFTGRLAFSWPRSSEQIPRVADMTPPLFPVGHGLT